MIINSNSNECKKNQIKYFWWLLYKKKCCYWHRNSILKKVFGPKKVKKGKETVFFGTCQNLHVNKCTNNIIHDVYIYVSIAFYLVRYVVGINIGKKGHFFSVFAVGKYYSLRLPLLVYDTVISVTESSILRHIYVRKWQYGIPWSTFQTPLWSILGILKSQLKNFKKVIVCRSHSRSFRLYYRNQEKIYSSSYINPLH